MSENEMILLLQKRRDILTKVKDYINNVNPSTVNFLDPSRDDIWQWRSSILTKKTMKML